MNRKSISKTITKINGTAEPAKIELGKKDIKNEIEKKEEQAPPPTKIQESEKQETELADEDDENINNNIEENEKETDTLPAEAPKDKEEGDAAEIDEPQIAENEKNAEDDMQVVDVYFVSVSSSGTITREKCKRTLEKSRSPMKDSLNALLKGTTKEEAKKGIRSFIPADTKLLSASIKEGVATINLSEDFQFNRYGIEGYNIQLQQIVFTACSFASVDSVQFLIEGQKRDLLGSEGVWIGSPLDVNSF